MVIHNLRSPRQWEIISSQVDFKGKSVIDLGCGWCDLLRFAWDAGASICVGTDKEKHDIDIGTRTRIVKADLEKWVCSEDILANSTYDIALCFSVLPYLAKPWRILEWMTDHAKIAFVECQYSGDGPGFDWLVDDNRMREWMENYWPSVKPIGHTIAKEQYKRTIWMCE